jgi:polyketide cyclase/dehydrase/lipid transport protein
MRFEKQITVDVASKKIFEYLADLTKHPEWGTRKMEITPATSGPVGVGSKFTHVGHQMGAHREEVTVTEFQPPTKLAFESKGSLGLMRHWFALEDRDGKTVLSKGVEAVRPSMLTRITSPAIRRAMPKALEQDLERIKARVEGSS